MMKTTSAVEFCLAVSLFVVILGSKSANATIDEINTKIDTNKSVTAAWNKCQPSQHFTYGKLIITWNPSSVDSHWTTESKVSVIGKKKTVTKSGTICAKRTRGQVNLNFFFENE